MDDAGALRDFAPPPLDAVERLVERASHALLDLQRPDGHFVFELEADCTIPSEFVLLKHYLGEPEDLDLERKIGVYLRRIQGAHGGWPLYHDGAFDISASVKAYFCLKMIGDDIDAPHMVRARQAIRAHGGAMAVNVFTRIQLALYGDMSWREIPTMPAEIIMLPRWFPITLGKMSYWARTVIVPLLVLMSLQPRARNPRGVHVPELFEDVTPVPRVSKGADLKKTWIVGFNALDAVLKALIPVWPRGLRRRAIERCRDWVIERLNGENGLGAIYPAMANSVMMFDALGYPPEHPAARHRPQVGGEPVGGQGPRDLLPAVRFACVGHSTRRPRPDGGRRREGRGQDAGGPGVAQAASGARHQGRLGRGAAERAAGRLGFPIPQRPLSRSGRHRRRGHGHGPGAVRGWARGLTTMKPSTAQWNGPWGCSQRTAAGPRSTPITPMTT